MRRRLPPLLLSLLACAPLLVAGTPAPELAGWIGNLASSVKERSAQLESEIVDLSIAAQRLTAAPYDDGAVLLLVRDAERVARSAEAVAMKAARLAELAEELAEGTGLAP
jgi:hypothetical protein